MRLPHPLPPDTHLLAAGQPQDGVRELLHLGFRRYAPAPALRPWVQDYWAIDTHLAVAREERMYPDGGTTITLNFGDGAALEPRFCAFTTLNQATLAGRIDLFGVRLRPGGAFGLLGLPVDALSDRTWSLQDLALAGAAQLYEQMREAAPPQRPRLMDNWLLNAVIGKPAPGLIQQLLPVLTASEQRLDDALLRAGTSRRSFERLFNAQVGLAPNQLKLLLRVKQARFLIKAAPWLSLADIALRCGYFDQAHFIRHFRRITGITPGRYRERQLARLARGEMVSRHAIPA